MRQGTFRGFEITIHDPGIALITMNQPEHLNGMTQPMKRDLVETIAQAQMDDGIRVLVITGSGRAFSAGDDITGRPRSGDGAEALVPDIPGGHHNPIGTYEGLRWLSQPLNVAMRSLDKLTIAAINGVAIQTGFSLALSCDFRIAADGARMGSGTLRFGLLPDEGGQFLVTQLIGVAKAMDFFMRNRIVTANEALRPGPRARGRAAGRAAAPRDGARRRAGERPAGVDAAPQALDLQRRRADVRARARRHRREDRDQRPPPGRARRHDRVPREAPRELQRLAGEEDLGTSLLRPYAGFGHGDVRRNADAAGCAPTSHAPSPRAD